MPVTPEALCRLASIVCVLNEAADNAAMQFSLSGEFYFTMTDAAGNRVTLDVDDGKIVVVGVA